MNQKYKRLANAIGSYLILVLATRGIVSSWLLATCIAAISFVIFAYLINSFKELIQSKVVMQTYVDRMEELRLQMVAKVNCAFCSKTNAVRFRMDIRNEFECEHCKKPNLLVINATTAQVTTPLVVPNIQN